MSSLSSPCGRVIRLSHFTYPIGEVDISSIDFGREKARFGPISIDWISIDAGTFFVFPV